MDRAVLFAPKGLNSVKFLGDCAVRQIGAILHALEEQLFPAMAARHTDMPVVPEGTRQSTMNINSIHGGEAKAEADHTGLPGNCVPDSCRVVIDRRFLIEEPVEQVRQEVVDNLEELKAGRARFNCELRELNCLISSMTDGNAPVVTTVARTIEDLLGRAPDYVASPGSYDQKHIDRTGKLKNCIAYGPGVLELAHEPDEWVGIDDMIDGAVVMAVSLGQLLAGDG